MILPPALPSFMLEALKGIILLFSSKEHPYPVPIRPLPCGGRLECSLMRPAIDTIPNCIIIFPGPRTFW